MNMRIVGALKQKIFSSFIWLHAQKTLAWKMKTSVYPMLRIIRHNKPKNYSILVWPTFLLYWLHPTKCYSHFVTYDFIVVIVINFWIANLPTVSSLLFKAQPSTFQKWNTVFLIACLIVSNGNALVLPKAKLPSIYPYQKLVTNNIFSHVSSAPSCQFFFPLKAFHYLLSK